VADTQTGSSVSSTDLPNNPAGCSSLIPSDSYCCSATYDELDKLTALRDEIRDAVTELDMDYMKLHEHRDAVQDVIRLRQQELASIHNEIREKMAEMDARKRDHATLIENNKREMMICRKKFIDFAKLMQAAVQKANWDANPMSVLAASLLHRLERMQHQFICSTSSHHDTDTRPNQSGAVDVTEFSKAYADLENTFRAIEQHHKTTESDLRAQLAAAHSNVVHHDKANKNSTECLASEDSFQLEIEALKQEISKKDNIIKYQEKLIKDQHRMSWGSAKSLSRIEKAVDAKADVWSSSKMGMAPETPQSFSSAKQDSIMSGIRQENEKLTASVEVLENEVVSLRKELFEKWQAASEEKSPSTAEIIAQLRFMTNENGNLRKEIWRHWKNERIKTVVDEAMLALEERIVQLYATAGEPRHAAGKSTSLAEVTQSLTEAITPQLQALVFKVTGLSAVVDELQSQDSSLRQSIAAIHQETLGEDLMVEDKSSGIHRRSLDEGVISSRRRRERVVSSIYSGKRNLAKVKAARDRSQSYMDEISRQTGESNRISAQYLEPLDKETARKGLENAKFASDLQQGSHFITGPAPAYETVHSDHLNPILPPSEDMGENDRSRHFGFRKMGTSSALVSALGPSLASMADGIHPQLGERLEELQQTIWAREGDLCDLKATIEELNELLAQADLTRLARLDAMIVTLRVRLDAVSYVEQTMWWGIENDSNATQSAFNMDKAKEILAENAVLKKALEKMGDALEERELILRISWKDWAASPGLRNRRICRYT